MGLTSDARVTNRFYPNLRSQKGFATVGSMGSALKGGLAALGGSALKGGLAALGGSALKGGLAALGGYLEYKHLQKTQHGRGESMAQAIGTTLGGFANPGGTGRTWTRAWKYRIGSPRCPKRNNSWHSNRV